jgi:MATE family multidrug resistance protein
MPSTASFLRESRSLLRLGGPLMLSQIAQVLMGLVDVVMSGQVGAGEQAVVALGVALWLPVFVCLLSVVQALSPVIAHHFGAGEREAVATDTREGIWLAVWASLLPIAVLPWAPRLLTLAGVEPAIASRTGVFLWGICLGLPAALVYRALAFYSTSINQTRPILVLAYVGLGVNAALNWVLIYGHFGLPAMGGAGCGWATGIGMWAGLLSLVAWTARASAYKPYYVWRAWRRPHWPAQKQLLRIGLPMGGAGLAEVAAFSSVAILIGRFGAVQIAGHQVALNFASLIFMVPFGLSSAIAIRVGQSLGARDPRLARRVAWTGIGLGLLIAAVFIIPIIALRHQVAAFYSADESVRALSADLLLFAAFWQLFDATQVCAMGALRGYRVTLLPMVLMAVAFWVLGIPIGTWLGYHGLPGGQPLHVYGFWVGLVVGLTTVSLALVAALRRIADDAVRNGRR